MILFLKAELPTDLTKELQFSIFLNKLLFLMFWLRYLYSCSKKQPVIATKLKDVSHQCLENESYHWWRLDHDISKPSITFTWACLIIHVNSHIVYMKLVDNISLLNFKIVVAKTLVGRYSNRNGSFYPTRLSKQKPHEPSMTREVPTRMLEFQ